MRRRRQTPEAERRTAIHEAAHVIASIMKGRRFLSVTIEPTEANLGCVRYRRTPRHLIGADAFVTPTRAKAIEDSVVSSLAGATAERLAAKQDGGRVRRGSHRADDETAFEMLSWLSCSPRQLAAHLRLCQIRAENLVLNNWASIIALADVLLVERTMSYGRVREVMASPSWSAAKRAVAMVPRSGMDDRATTEVPGHDRATLAR